MDTSLVPRGNSSNSAMAGRTKEIVDFSNELAEGGAKLIQYRNKLGGLAETLSQSRELRHRFDRSTSEMKLIMNDRADVCLAAEFDGVHLGQEDLSVAGARKICRTPLLVGISTHNPQQVKAADHISADYIAIGPVFATASKAHPNAIVGLDGVRAARALTKKPLVAIGGITRANCRQVIESGADSVAVISDLLLDPRMACQEFIQLLG